METEVQPLFQSNVYQIRLGEGNTAGKRFLIIDTNLAACTTVQEDSRTKQTPNNSREIDDAASPR